MEDRMMFWYDKILGRSCGEFNRVTEVNRDDVPQRIG